MHLTTSLFRRPLAAARRRAGGRLLRAPPPARSSLHRAPPRRGRWRIEDCATIAAPTDGGFLLNGRKIFFTESDVATHFTTCAKLEHPVIGPQMVFFNGIPIDTPGLEVVRTWDTLGMRATQSNDLRLEDAFVPEEALFHAYPVGRLDAAVGLTVMSLNVPSFGAIALGIATAGMEIVRRSVIDRGRSADPEVQHAFAQMEVLLDPRAQCSTAMPMSSRPSTARRCSPSPTCTRAATSPSTSPARTRSRSWIT